MLRFGDRWVHSSQDLVGFVRCERLTALRRAGIRPSDSKPSDGADIEPHGLDAVIIGRGHAHEDAVGDRLRADGLHVEPVALDTFAEDEVVAASQRTRELLHDGVDVIHQAVLYDGTWFGLADFLIRVEGPTDLGDFGYEVSDAKLTRRVKPEAVLQASLYSVLLEPIQGRMPARLHLDLGGGVPRETRATARTVAYTRRLMRRYLEDVQHDDGIIPDPSPIAWCPRCDHAADCGAWLRDHDDVTFIANLRIQQRDRLRAVGLETLPQVAALHSADKGESEHPARIGGPALTRLASQAAAQLATREQPTDDGRPPVPFVELLEPARDDDGTPLTQGLLALPEPSPGDLFYDIEGDPLVAPHGLEYLHGIWLGEDHEAGVAEFLAAGGQRCDDYVWMWAEDSEGEARAVAGIIDLLVARCAAYPAAHVYHYASYEISALYRMAQRHALREAELDDLLRAGMFVDLYRVVRQGLRIGAESYSIKALEPIYLDAVRASDVGKGDDSIVEHLRYLEAAEEEQAAIRDAIVLYNQEDCRSTSELRDWLEQQRAELLERHSVADGRDWADVASHQPSDPKDEEVEEHRLVDSCLERRDASDDPNEREVWETLAGLAGFHRRERNTGYAEWFRQLEINDESDAAASSEVLGALHLESVEAGDGIQVAVYRAPDQDHRVEVGDDVADIERRDDDGRPSRLGKVVHIRSEAETESLLVGIAVPQQPPASLLGLCSQPPYFNEKPIVAQLHAIIDEATVTGIARRSAAIDLLMRRVPPQLVHQGGVQERPEERAIRVATTARDGVLAIQGPPGTGKTRVAARLARELAARGLRVGVTALSHRAITEVVDRIVTTPPIPGAAPIRICQAVSAKTSAAARREREGHASGENATLDLKVSNPKAAECSLDHDVTAGTKWLWTSPKLDAPVDVLIIDEASQFSLADAMACAAAATTLVLVGDPQQLSQPTQAVHPADSGTSAMQRLVGADGDRAVVAAGRGVFLDVSYRMHPTVCEVVSTLAYDGALTADRSCARIDLRDAGDLSGVGVRFVPVDHDGNRSSSPEEAAVVADLVDRLVGGTFVDSDGDPQPLALSDIAVITPFNAQVARLERELADDVKIGTVDRFQGSTASVVIVSLACSSPEDAPRGLDFVLARNRLNVAMSRARAAVFVVGSPKLMDASPTTVQVLEAANDLCLIADHAS